MNYGLYSANTAPVTSGKPSVCSYGRAIHLSCGICSMKPYARSWNSTSLCIMTPCVLFRRMYRRFVRRPSPMRRIMPVITRQNPATGGRWLTPPDKKSSTSETDKTLSIVVGSHPTNIHYSLIIIHYFYYGRLFISRRYSEGLRHTIKNNYHHLQRCHHQARRCASSKRQTEDLHSRRQTTSLQTHQR